MMAAELARNLVADIEAEGSRLVGSMVVAVVPGTPYPQRPFSLVVQWKGHESSMY